MSRRCASSLVAFALLSAVAWASVGPLGPSSASAQSAQGDVQPEAASRGSYDPWQREFLLQTFGSLRPAAAEVHANRPRSLPAGAPGALWTELPPPVARAAAAGIVDTVRRQVLLFGGSDGVNRNDVWVLGLGDTAWHKMVPLGAHPSPRVGHTAVLDLLRDRMIVFGGWDGEYRNDVWTLSLTDSIWTQLAPTGTAPSGRGSHSAVYDAALDRMVVFGGWDGTSSNEVWALDLSGAGAWSRLTPTGAVPAARYGHSAVYDPNMDRMVVFGGERRASESDFEFLNDTWVLDLDGAPAWNRLATRLELDNEAIIAGSPPVRYAHAAVFFPDSGRMLPDSSAMMPDSGRMIVNGGWFGLDLDDTWELSLIDTTWRRIEIGVPPTRRSHHVALLDSRTSRMLVLWGWGDGNPRGDQKSLALAGAAGWTTLASIRTTPSRRFAHSAVIDRQRDRMVVFGGADGGDHKRDVWQLLFPTSAWQPLIAGGTAPPFATDHAAVFDSSAVRLIAFGGREIVNGGIDTVFHDEVSVLALSGTPTWTRPAAPPLPRTREGHTLVFDESRGRLLLFGGRDSLGSLRNDVWQFIESSQTWSQIVPVGTPPSPRTSHTAIYDPVRDRMIVFGGLAPLPLDEVWQLSFSGTPQWLPIVPTAGPVARSEHAAVYDPIGDRMVVFGGLGGPAGADTLGDLWALPLANPAAWNALSTSGAPPVARFAHTAVYDTADHRVVLFGGKGRGGDARGKLNDLWTLTLGDLAWQEVEPLDLAATDRPRGLAGHTAVYDGRRGHMILFGGGSDTLKLSRIVWTYILTNGSWITDSTWTAPTPLSGHAAVLGGSDNFLMFGGSNADPLNNNTTFLSGLWTYSLQFPRGWTGVTGGGVAVGGRYGHTMVLDALRNRVLLFGGLRELSAGDSARHSSTVWALSLTDFGWSKVEVLGTPPAGRDNHTAIYDPVRDRMIVFGGSNGLFLNDVWALDLGGAATWIQITPSGASPPARYGHSAVYDPQGDVMQVFGGWTGNYEDDVWELSLAGAPAWAQVTAVGQEAVGRVSHAAVFDAVRRRTVVFGGFAASRDGASRSDTWFLTEVTGGDLISSAAVLELDAQPGVVHLTWQVHPGANVMTRVYRSIDGAGWAAIASVRADARGTLVFADRDLRGGNRFGYRLGVPRAGREDAVGEVWVNAPSARSALFPVVHPSPASQGFSVSFTLPDARPVTLEVFDLAGRRVWDRRLEQLGPGSHTLRISEGGATFKPGLYLVRLSHGAKRLSSRVVVTP